MEDGGSSTEEKEGPLQADLPFAAWIRYYLWELLIKIPIRLIPPLFWSLPIFWDGADDKSASCVRATVWLKVNVFLYAPALVASASITLYILVFLCRGGKRNDLLGPKLKGFSESCVEYLKERLSETQLAVVIMCGVTFLQIQRILLGIVWFIWQCIGVHSYNNMNHVYRCIYVGERIKMNLYYLILRFVVLEPLMYFLSRYCFFRTVYAYFRKEQQAILAAEKKKREEQEEKDDQYRQLAGEDTSSSEASSSEDLEEASTAESNYTRSEEGTREGREIPTTTGWRSYFSFR